MFDKYTYRTKLIGLGVISILLFLAAYKRSFSLTITALSEIENLDIQIDNASNSGYKINELKIEINNINNIIGKENFTSDFVQRELVDEISDYSVNNSIKLHGISETHSYELKDFEIFSNEIIIEGDFIVLLKFIYYFEKEVKYARIASSEFYTEKDYRTKKKQLYAKVYLQHFRKK